MQNQQQIARLKRAVTQKNIKLISSTLTDTYLLYKVLGNTGSFYDVKVPCEGTLSCKCIDFLKNKARCKHLHFIYVKVFKLLPEVVAAENNFISGEVFASLCEKHKAFVVPKRTDEGEGKGSKDKEVTARNATEDCCICFEKMPESNTEPNTMESTNNNSFICSTCQNGFHRDCIMQVMRYNTCCPLCRSTLTLPPDNDNDNLEDDKTVASLILQIQRL